MLLAAIVYAVSVQHFSVSVGDIHIPDTDFIPGPLFVQGPWLLCFHFSPLSTVPGSLPSTQSWMHQIASFSPAEPFNCLFWDPYHIHLIFGTGKT